MLALVAHPVKIGIHWLDVQKHLLSHMQKQSCHLHLDAFDKFGEDSAVPQKNTQNIVSLNGLFHINSTWPQILHPALYLELA